MTIKSLKYSHNINCIANKQSEPTEIIEKTTKEKNKNIEIPKHTEIPNHRQIRMTERSRKIALLASQAFWKIISKLLYEFRESY